MIIENEKYKSTTQFKTFSIFLTFVLLFVLLSIYVDSFNIKKCKTNDKFNGLMKNVEIYFKKIYPIGNDHFSINHYPDYLSFFNQFQKYDYYIYKKNNKIKGTFCMACFKNNIKYICDLKTLESGNNLTYKFMFKHYYDTIFSTNIKNTFSPFFGIVMQPNKIIDKISKNYFISKKEDLLLFQIKFDNYKKNYDLLSEIFTNHFCVEGYKKLILESSKSQLKICHIATPTDVKFVEHMQDKICENKLKEYEIMFCLPSKNKYVYSLKSKKIFHTSTMTIFGMFCDEINWNFIKTYMI